MKTRPMKPEMPSLGHGFIALKSAGSHLWAEDNGGEQRMEDQFS